MRILMLTDVYPPVIGGMEQYVQRLSRELARRGHQVSVATLALPDSAPLEVDDGVTVHRIRALVQSVPALHGDAHRPFAPPVPDPRAAWALSRLLRSAPWDIVHSHNWLVHSFLPLRAWTRARLVVTLHDYSLVCARKTLLRHGQPCGGPGIAKCVGCAVDFYGAARGLPTLLGNWGMQLPLQRSVDMFLPVSQAVADGNRLPTHNLPYRVIPNFVADELLTANDDDEPRLAQLPAGPFLLFVGGLDRIKGVDVLLQAYARLENPPPLVLIGASRPDAPTELPPNVMILRDWPHAAVQAAWRRSLIGLVPSVWAEPCPTVALEAMAAGRPVIASRIGGLSDLVVDGETGLLVPAGDPLALQQAMARLLAEPEVRQRMGLAARRRLESSFTARSVVPEIERTYALLGETACQAA